MRHLIALVLLLFISGAQAEVLELPNQGADVISIQAVVPLDRLTAEERSRLGAIVRAIPQGTRRYSKTDMRIATQGEPIVSYAMADHVRIGYSVPPENLRSGIALMVEMLRFPRLSPQDFASSPPIQHDAWMGMLHRASLPEASLREDRVRTLVSKVFEPSRVTIAVAGKFATGMPTTLWNEAKRGWNPPPRLPFRDDYSVSTESPLADGVELRTTKPYTPGTLLAVFALGVGKGSSLFRVARENLGVSYRQEAVVLPSERDFDIRLLIAGAKADKEAIRLALEEDIAKWAEQDRLRAVGMARAVFVGGLDLSPLYFSPDGPIRTGLEDEAYLSAYWQMKTGEPWNATAIVDALSRVSLQTLKTAAQEIVNP